MTSDIEIARAATLKPMVEIAAGLDVPADAIIPFGRSKAKLSGEYIATLKDRPRGKLILVTAISPTPAGEGKTTTTVGLGDGLARIGKKVAICLREPSLGPCFGMKGGAAGGGMAQVVPMEDINLHFTGDFHAITSAHNLLAALVDNHVHWGNEQQLDTRRIAFRRVMDMNDRSLRNLVTGLGGAAHGTPREAGFDITVASEVMAILCLARDLADLEDRLGKIVVGERADRSRVTAADIGAAGAMTVLLKDAFQPNLVQTLEHTPTFIHGGPFANIAHGCNTLVATDTALRLADYVVTEAGFGADLGAEKFFDIKCRKGGLEPSAAVLVATIRALKMNGGTPKDQLGGENVAAVEAGCANLGRHIENMAKFGVPVVVAINHFIADSEAEIAAVQSYCEARGVKAVLATHWAEGGQGAEKLAEAVSALVEGGTSRFAPLYGDDLSLADKIEIIATSIYCAGSVVYERSARQQLQRWQEAGYGRLPVCMAKTQYSFSADPSLIGAPEGHELHVREVRLSAGAGFVVAVCGAIMTMPGLPRKPAALDIHLNGAGEVEGLF
ncbi:formate--tetrahydrofolate ligase [Maricaulis sp. W15]|uniref:formate--tetrahydrofolate ligase n=1 Tax=Maricaulis sp. W15 TaxID=1772333 RepID=UPI0009491A33|nr:formate--tetrahydrofolate ligase [Maricaulis sp. W15]OLF77937.1 formate--tetrahydrofolate ligase [Maricaulis sp. W15]